MNNKIVARTIQVTLGMMFFLGSKPALAAFQLLPGCATGSGDCSTCDFILFFINWANILGAVAGTMALVFLIIGGLYWVFSFGNQERVKRGKDILVNTFVGLFIMMFAWIGVNFIIHALSGDDLSDARIFSRQWWDPACSVDYEDCNVTDSKGVPKHYIGDTCEALNHVCYRELGEVDDKVCDSASGKSCECISQCAYIGKTTGYSCTCESSDCASKWGGLMGGAVGSGIAHLVGRKEMKGDFCPRTGTEQQNCCCSK